MKEEYDIKIDTATRVRVRTIDSKFSLVYLTYTSNGWIDIARIDNYPHEGKDGTHIHRINDERVEFRDMDFEEAAEAIIRIGKSIMEKMKNGIY